MTTKNIINMASFYKKAIMDNKTNSKDPADVSKKVEYIKKRILANLYHSVYNPDPAVQCSTSIL